MFFKVLCVLLAGCTYAKDCVMETKQRIDCYPETSQLTESECIDRGCCYKPFSSEFNSKDYVPWCFFPKDYDSYNVSSITEGTHGIVGVLKHVNTFAYPPNVLSTLKFNISFETSSIVRVKITDAMNMRYEVPISPPSYDKKDVQSDRLYAVDVSKNDFAIVVKRKMNKEIIFDSSIAPLLFGNQFLQISTSLSSAFVYGMGERHGKMLVDTNWNRLSFWARDQIPTANANLYGDHPFYMVVGKDGNAYGVAFVNSNAKDAELQPLPSVTWRSIGGIFDIYILVGPTPSDVIKQYTSVVGRSFMPPLWSLGFHLCRWGYFSANTTMDYVKKMRKASIPQDVQWNDIDYMDSKLDFTRNMTTFKNLPEVVADLHNNKQHYMMIIDPGISNMQPKGKYLPYDIGHKMDIFVKTETGQEAVGIVWPGRTVFPDFSHPKAADYWQEMLAKYHSDVDFDGVWIDMNEPSNFINGDASGCNNSTIDNPPYTPRLTGGTLSSRTLCPSNVQYLSHHYDLHSLTGTLEMKATSEALIKIRNRRPFVISRSTFMGAGRYGGHWTGDVVSSWDYLKLSIPSIINFNMYGIPMVGADICGFGQSTTEELCIRWTQLGAFYPFSRNHNDIAANPQAPVDFRMGTQTIIKHALDMRYTLMPYLYTLFHYAHVNGTTVARPMFFEFPNDLTTYDIDTQFLWGSGLLINPVLEASKTSVDAYFPKGIWYPFYGSSNKPITSPGKHYIVSANITEIPLFIRGGSIIPCQFSGTTTDVLYPYWLYVAPDQSNQACGTLYIDDGDSLNTYESGNYTLLDMVYKNNNLSITVSHGADNNVAYKTSLVSIFVQNVKERPSKVTINNAAVYYTFISHSNTLEIMLNHALNNRMEIIWEFK